MNSSLRKYIFCVVFLLASAIVSAVTGEELVTDTWFFDLESVNVNGYDFSVDISGSKIYVNYANGYYLISGNRYPVSGFLILNLFVFLLYSFIFFNYSVIVADCLTVSVFWIDICSSPLIL